MEQRDQEIISFAQLKALSENTKDSTSFDIKFQIYCLEILKKRKLNIKTQDEFQKISILKLSFENQSMLNYFKCYCQFENDKSYSNLNIILHQLSTIIIGYPSARHLTYRIYILLSRYSHINAIEQLESLLKLIEIEQRDKASALYLGFTYLELSWNYNISFVKKTEYFRFAIKLFQSLDKNLANLLLGIACYRNYLSTADPNEEMLNTSIKLLSNLELTKAEKEWNNLTPFMDEWWKEILQFVFGVFQKSSDKPPEEILVLMKKWEERMGYNETPYVD